MLLRNKKGAEFMTDWPFWLLYIIAVGVIASSLATISVVFIKKSASIPEGLEEATILPRFHGSEDCFAYKDDLGKVHPGKIDLKKFTQEKMQECFPQSDVKYAFHITLESRDANVGKAILKTDNWVESPQYKENVEKVLVLKEDKIYKANLIIKVKNV